MEFYAVKLLNKKTRKRFFIRSRGDSNPRYPFGAQLLSREPDSASLAPLQRVQLFIAVFFLIIPICFVNKIIGIFPVSEQTQGVFGFQSQTSCLLLPPRLRVVWRVLRQHFFIRSRGDSGFQSQTSCLLLPPPPPRCPAHRAPDFFSQGLSPWNHYSNTTVRIPQCFCNNKLILKRILIGIFLPISEQGGFEPPVPCGTTVFKTASFNHSDTAPVRVLYIHFFDSCQDDTKTPLASGVFVISAYVSKYRQALLVEKKSASI